jgi:hypothetical protein
MPSTRVIAGAAVCGLFICGLFGGQGMAQTASTEPVGKPMQLLQHASGQVGNKTIREAGGQALEQSSSRSKKACLN